MTHVKGWTVLSKDYLGVLRHDWRNRPESERWVPMISAIFTPAGLSPLRDPGELATLYEAEDQAKADAREVGGIPHRVDRQE